MQQINRFHCCNNTSLPQLESPPLCATRLILFLNLTLSISELLSEIFFVGGFIVISKWMHAPIRILPEFLLIFPLISLSNLTPYIVLIKCMHYCMHDMVWNLFTLCNTILHKLPFTAKKCQEQTHITHCITPEGQKQSSGFIGGFLIEITIKQLDHSYVLLLNIFEIISKKHFDTN